VSFRGVVNIADVAVKTLEGVLDILCGASSHSHISSEAHRGDAQSPREFHDQKEAEARREEALDSMAEDRRSGRALNLTDIANLSKQDALGIKAYGDDGVRMLIEQEEKRERERQRERMRER
jgi:hypothetical protein